MGINEHINSIIRRFFDDSMDVIEIGLVMLAGSRMLDGLPSREQAHAVEAPMLQASEMFVRLGERKRPADEGNRAVVGKIGRMFGAAVRPWHFAIAAEIDAAQNDAPAGLVDKPTTLHVQFLHGAPRFCYAGKQNKIGGPCPRQSNSARSDRMRSTVASSGIRRSQAACAT